MSTTICKTDVHGTSKSIFRVVDYKIAGTSLPYFIILFSQNPSLN